MAQPKTGNSHVRGSQFIGSGLYVTGVARIGGAVNVGGALTVTGALTVAGAIVLSGAVSLPSGTVQNTDIATGANGLLYSQTLHFAPIHGASYTSLTLLNRISSLSGQCAAGLKFMPPGIAITVRGLGFSLQTAPGTTGLRVGIRSIPSSGAQVHKAYVTTLAAKISVYKGGLTATIPAGNAFGLSLNRAGTTVSGSNLNVTVYYTRN